jgi:predicted nucleotidyltransferase
MSRIFVWEDIAAGRVPSTENFMAVAAHCRQRLMDMPNFAGAILYGSVLMGNAEPWSDLDLHVSYEGLTKQDRYATIDTLRELRGHARKCHVPLLPVLVEIQAARLGHHDITLGFFTHLKWARDHGGLIGPDPLPHILIEDTPERRRLEAVNYIMYGIRTLTKGLVRFGELSEEALNNLRHEALDIPFHAARRMLECQGQECARLGRSEVLQLYRSRVRAEDSRYLATLFDFLVGYKKALKQQIVSPDERSYRICLQSADGMILRGLNSLHATRTYL